DFAGALPAVEALAQDALDRVQVLFLRAEQTIGLHELPGMLNALAQNDITRARMWITPSAERVLAFSEEIRHRSDNVTQLRLSRGQRCEPGHPCQRVADDVRFGISDVQPRLIIVNER